MTTGEQDPEWEDVQRQCREIAESHDLAAILPKVPEYMMQFGAEERIKKAVQEHGMQAGLNVISHYIAQLIAGTTEEPLTVHLTISAE